MEVRCGPISSNVTESLDTNAPNHTGTIAPKPSSTQGYGRSILTEALSLGERDEPSWKESVRAMEMHENGYEQLGMPYVEQGTSKEWEINVKSDATFFKATIGWSDPTSTNLIGTWCSSAKRKYLFPSSLTQVPARITCHFLVSLARNNTTRMLRSNTGTTAALTNDIDLVVIDADGTERFPILSSGVRSVRA